MISAHLPERFHEGMLNHLLFGIPAGGFLSAVLVNDLKESFARADGQSVHELPGIVAWLYNYAPRAAWGSPSAVQQWARWRRDWRSDVAIDAVGTADKFRSILSQDPDRLRAHLIDGGT